MSDELSTPRIPSLFLEGSPSTGGFEEERMKRRLKERLAGASLPPVEIDRFVVLRRLGAGGLGIVYEAYDPFLDRRVALKIVRPSTGRGPGDAGAKESLLREAQAMAQLSHRNVLPVHDAGEHDNGVFLVLELVDGDDLAAHLRKHELPWQRVLELYLQAGRGLAAAHAAGLIHRDFKPSNVMVGADGRVLVMDFGLALPVGELSSRTSSESSGSVSQPHSPLTAGTPAYMAPEQLRGEFVDARSDLFSFCVSLYEGLFGRRPFSARDEQERLVEIAEPVFEHPKERRVPAWVTRILVRGLSNRAEDRYASMEDLLRRLEGGLRRRRLWMWGLPSLLAAGVGAFMLGRAPTPCSDIEARAASEWSDAIRVQVAKRFEQSGLPYAADSWTRVRPGLDAYADAWIDTRRATCRATEVDHHQSADVMHRRYACLEREWANFRSLVRALRMANATTIEGAVGAVEALGDPSRCDGSVSPEEPGLAPPPALAEAVELDRHKLSEARTLQSLGELDRARELTRAVVHGKSAGVYSPLRVEAQLAAAEGLIASGEVEAGADALEALLPKAEAAHHPIVVARVLVELMRVRGKTLARWDEGLVWAKAAEAALVRVGEPAELRVDFLAVLGRIAADSGKTEMARAKLEEAFELSLAHFGEKHPETTKVLGELAIAAKLRGEFSHALELREEVQRRTLALFGPDHPQSAMAALNLGVTLSAMSRHEQALMQHERALEIWTRTLPPKHPQLSLAHGNVAVELSQLGRTEEAIEHYQRELELVEEQLGASHPRVSRTHHNLAMVYLRAKRLDDALAEITLAQGAGTERFDAGHPRAARLADTRGDVLFAMGRLDDALVAFESAKQIVEAAEDPDPAILVGILSTMAEVYIAKHDAERAQVFVDQARVGALELASAGRPGYLGRVHYVDALLLWDQPGERARARARLREASRLIRSQEGIFWGEMAEQAEALLASPDE